MDARIDSFEIGTPDPAAARAVRTIAVLHPVTPASRSSVERPTLER